MQSTKNSTIITMFLSTCLFLLIITLVKGENCDKSGILVYEDLGCTPIHADGKKCPIKYTCTGLKLSRKFCFFHGKAYKDGEIVGEGPTVPPCHLGCYCSPESSRFLCAEVDCPNWFGDDGRNENCYDNDTLDSCCPVGAICPPFDDIQKCIVEGKEYKEGQTFYPANTCLTCVCLKGFKGKFEEPFCRRRPCGEQLAYQGRVQSSCAPFYRSGKDSIVCCPDDWICSNESENIIGESKSDDSCKFGNKNVKVGQHLVKHNFTDGFGHHFAEVKCECVIPPLLKCVNV